MTTRKGLHFKAKIIRFVAYLRCSSDEQADREFSTIDNQRELARLYIERRIAEIRVAGGQAEFGGFYQDDGKTGTNLNRPGWRKLLVDAQAGIVGVVVVTYMSRLGRGSSYDIAEHQLSEVGASVEMVEEKFTSDMSGRINKTVKKMIDEFYPIQVSEFTKTKQVGMVAAGHWTGGPVPFGYRSEAVPGTQGIVLSGGNVKLPPKRLVPYEPEAQHVRQAMQVFSLTRNMGAVLRYLRSATPDRRWTMDQVRNLLTNEVYRGCLRFGANVNLTAHEAIVSEQLWDSVQAALQAREEAKAVTSEQPIADRPAVYEKPERTNQISYYLRGIVFCPHCGGRMTPTGAHGRSGKLGYYVCTIGGSRSKSDRTCPVQRVNSAKLHDAVLGEIARIGEHPTRLASLLREAVKALPSSTDLSDELKRELRNRREAEKKIGKLTSAIMNGDGTGVASIKVAIGQQESVLAAVESRIQDLEKESQRRRPNVPIPRRCGRCGRLSRRTGNILPRSREWNSCRFW